MKPNPTVVGIGAMALIVSGIIVPVLLTRGAVPLKIMDRIELWLEYANPALLISNVVVLGGLMGVYVYFSQRHSKGRESRETALKENECDAAVNNLPRTSGE